MQEVVQEVVQEAVGESCCCCCCVLRWRVGSPELRRLSHPLCWRCRCWPHRRQRLASRAERVEVASRLPAAATALDLRRPCWQFRCRTLVTSAPCCRTALHTTGKHATCQQHMNSLQAGLWALAWTGACHRLAGTAAITREERHAVYQYMRKSSWLCSRFQCSRRATLR